MKSLEIKIPQFRNLVKPLFLIVYGLKAHLYSCGPGNLVTSKYNANETSKLGEMWDTEVEDEEKVLTELFQKYNNVNIDSQSSTIFLESHKDPVWIKVLTEMDCTQIFPW